MRRDFAMSILRHGARFLISAALGIAGGAICGAAIISFSDLIGRNGTTGEEYLGYWSAASAEIGAIYGGFFGVFLGAIAYLLFVRKTSFRRALLPATVGTLLGGFIGAIVGGPPLAVLTGAGGFFVALSCVRYGVPSFGTRNTKH